MTYKDPHIIVCHDNLNLLGGCERVSLGFIRAAKELGWAVDLVTLIKTDWLRLERVFGSAIRPDREFSLFESNKPLDHFYGRFLFVPFALRLMSPTAVTVNTMGYRWLPVRCDVVYEHTPPFLWPNVATGSSLVRRISFAPYSMVGRLLLRELKSYIITNSSYCAMNIARLTGRSADVVYPPVDLGEFINDDNQREDLVITCGRYHQEKNYELLILIAERLKYLKFLIIGSFSPDQDGPYLNKLQEMILEKGLTNVTLMTNVPPNNRAAIYHRAKVYLHTMTDEDFGIAVVEAMAAGLVPVVHKSGGLWSDVVGEGKFGYGYTSVKSAIEAVQEAFVERRKIATLMGQRAKVFARENFELEVKRILREVSERKSETNSNPQPSRKTHSVLVNN